MEPNNLSSTDLSPHPQLNYFDIQAYVGTTKHMGGLTATKELIGFCRIDQDNLVLEFGCGVGATSCYLAQSFGCSVVAVDIRVSMVELARQRAQKMGVDHLITFFAADASNLPFEDNHFDVLICESVLTFTKNRHPAISEFARVAKIGGYVGLNEEIWLKQPPPEMRQYAARTWEIIDIPSAGDWERYLAAAGLRELLVEIHKVDLRRESSQINRYSIGDMWRMVTRVVSLYLKNPALRQHLRKQRHLPRGFFDYLGYGIFVGRKGEIRAMIN